MHGCCISTTRIGCASCWNLSTPSYLSFMATTHVVWLFHKRFPNASIPEIGPAAWSIRYSDPFFDNQDAWNEMELCNQSSRFRLTEDRDFIIDGPGLPFERLYFRARAQLSYATDELFNAALAHQTKGCCRQLRGVSARRTAKIQSLTTPLSHLTPPLPSPLSLPFAVFASAAAGPGAVTLRRRARLLAQLPCRRVLTDRDLPCGLAARPLPAL
jgi:hypothetical protein